MSAVTVLLVLLLGGINLINAVSSRADSAELLKNLAALEGFSPEYLSVSVTHTHTSLQASPLLFADEALKILGAAIAAIATMVKFGTVTIMPLWMVAVTIAIALSVTLIYLAIEMPIFFKLGLTKARLYFTLPFFACMLFMLKPVQRFFEGLAARFGSIAETIGNPAPILAVLIVIAAVLYGISSIISTRIYEKREL